MREMQSTDAEQSHGQKPAVLTETALAAWVRLHKIKQREVAEALECTQQQAQRYLLPREHKNHNRPGPEKSDLLRAWSRGAFHAGNFADPFDPSAPLPPPPVNSGQALADAV